MTMPIARALFLIVALLATCRGFAQELTWDFDPLPTVLPIDFLAQEGAVEYVRLRPEAGLDRLAPFGSDIRFDGVRYPRAEELRRLNELVGSRHLAHLPAGARIRVSRDGQGREIWDYPVGTRVYDLTEFKTSPSWIHELRVLQKRADGSWAYAVYVPLDQSPTAPLLILQTYAPDPYPPPVKIYRVETAPGQTLIFTHLGIRLGACRNCHFSVSPSAYQYATSALAGPCGFVPANPQIAGDWAARYQAARGEPPFASAGP